MARFVKSIVAASLLAALMAPTAQASCESATVAGGNSEVDQYTETVPGSCGPENTSPTGTGVDQGGDSDDAGPAAPATTIEELRSHGADGAGVAALVGGDVADSAGGDRGGQGDQSLQGATDAGAGGTISGDGSVLSGVARSVGGSDDSGGLGLILPILLAASLVGAFAYLMRQRGRTPPT